MISCKYCNKDILVKYGKSKDLRQIYYCKSCNKYFREGEDSRKKYTEKEQETAFILYTEGNGFRRIARILSKIFNKKIYYQTVVKWLKSRHKSLPEIEENSEEIEILELDELFTFFKKSQNITEEQRNLLESLPEYGLLLTETKCVCVRLK